MSRRPSAKLPAITALLADLTDSRLTGAACVGRSQLFDPRGLAEDDDDYAYRLQAAQAVCARCPVRDPCAEVAAGLGRGAVGVWAGRVHNRQRGRPSDGGTAA